MELSKNDVAVVTGAGSGIGRSTAIALAERGVNLALVDVSSDGLVGTAESATSHGVRVVRGAFDVSNREAMLAFAEETFGAFGKVSLLFNNAAVAGVAAPGWAIPHRDWQWVLGVDLFGVLYGIEAFVPRMVESGSPGIVVNTTSIGGLISGPSNSYSVAKHAVTRLTEGLYYDFRAHAPSMRAALLVPGPIHTGINARWGERLDAEVRAQIPDEAFDAMTAGNVAIDQMQELIGMHPDEVAALLLTAIAQGDFYVYTHPESIKEMAKLRYDDFLGAKQPSPEAGDVQGMFERWAAHGCR